MKFKYKAFGVLFLMASMLMAMPFVVAEHPDHSPDLNGDGSIDDLDMEILMSVWGSPDGACYDLTGDGMVSVPDLLKMLGSWTG